MVCCDQYLLTVLSGFVEKKKRRFVDKKFHVDWLSTLVLHQLAADSRLISNTWQAQAKGRLVLLIEEV